ncbi:NAD(P)-binding domain-containing protein [Allokutzneria sp. A3M-2-11 16]|uniref:NADPH-dependent F420 reductase n=1 Tax=Allokutzneria sp. A3M-2-11 16 TaxID=2962043 RepID=UPI0020B6C3A1|nr:NAD(P)-binding domain-containing protein [Allokutzneria sp. A3M-2-11 16]MCP3802913.1 NAD(P)-binding domain-containing protein [Allokutzneria sp. A3M-2-11 16]
MRIGILGTGTLAAALAESWARAGHDIEVGGRSPEKALAIAEKVGGHAAHPREVVRDKDSVLLAVSWSGIEDMLRSAGATEGALRGTPVIDPTNAVEHGVGVLLAETSAAERVAELAPGAHVVKAFHLFAADQWTRPDASPVTVAMCGDAPEAVRVACGLVRDAGGNPAVLGPLSRARQLEEAAGFVIGLAFSGFDPNSAVPRVGS